MFPSSIPSASHLYPSSIPLIPLVPHLHPSSIPLISHLHPTCISAVSHLHVSSIPLVYHLHPSSFPPASHLYPIFTSCISFGPLVVPETSPATSQSVVVCRPHICWGKSMCHPLILLGAMPSVILWPTSLPNAPKHICMVKSKIFL